MMHITSIFKTEKLHLQLRAVTYKKGIELQELMQKK